MIEVEQFFQDLVEEGEEIKKNSTPEQRQKVDLMVAKFVQKRQGKKYNGQ